MKVRISPLALQRARIVTSWWRKNRPGVEETFQQEFELVTNKLAAMSPRGPIGTIYRTFRGAEVRKVLLPKTEQHIYYSIDTATDTVVIRTIWGARRGRPPKL